MEIMRDLLTRGYDFFILTKLLALTCSSYSVFTNLCVEKIFLGWDFRDSTIVREHMVVHDCTCCLFLSAFALFFYITYYIGKIARQPNFVTYLGFFFWSWWKRVIRSCICYWKRDSLYVLINNLDMRSYSCADRKSVV